MHPLLDQRLVRRRELLRLGALGIGGLGLPGSLSATFRDDKTDSHVTGKSVIFLFQQGGPSQFETFDPKLDAPGNIRTMTGTTQTSLPGINFGDSLPQLAKLAHELTIVRSYRSRNAGHNIKPLVGPGSKNANIGVHYSRIVGATRRDTGTPTSSIVYPAAVAQDVPGPQARGDLQATGSYSSNLAPFVPGGGGQLQSDMQVNLPPQRLFQKRQQLLKDLDRMDHSIQVDDDFEQLNALRNQAYEMLESGGVARALDLSREDPEVLARYDTSGYAQGDRWNKVNRGKKGYYNAQARSIGHLLCLARRLCEAGCGFVTIHAGYAGVWDMHADGNNLDMLDGMEAVGRPFDHAVAAFIEDLKNRGLEDDILLVATGEMGRTPRINGRGGRDHWSRLAPLMMYGGGIPKGEVIGQSTRDGGEPDSTPYGPENLISTILNTLMNRSELRLRTGIPSQILDLMDQPSLILPNSPRFP